MTLPRGRDRQGNQGRVGEEGGRPAPAEGGEPEKGQGATRVMNVNLGVEYSGRYAALVAPVNAEGKAASGPDRLPCVNGFGKPMVRRSRRWRALRSNVPSLGSNSLRSGSKKWTRRATRSTSSLKAQFLSRPHLWQRNF